MAVLYDCLSVSENIIVFLGSEVSTDTMMRAVGRAAHGKLSHRFIFAYFAAAFLVTKTWPAEFNVRLTLSFPSFLLIQLS